MTTPTDLAQALRELASDWRNKEVGETCDANAGYNRARKHCAAELEKVLKAHESRAQPAEPDGYAYRYADGFLRFNQGAPVNGGKPVEAIPFYFAPQLAQPAPQRERGGRMKAFGKSFLHAIRVAILIVLIVCLSPLIVAALALNAIGMLWETTW